MIKNGASIHQFNNSALNWSAYYGHLGVVKHLVENGANIHYENEYALKQSIKRGHLEVVKYLVENGADIHGSYALISASTHGHLEIVEYLIENGADISLLSEDEIVCLIEENFIINGIGSEKLQNAWAALPQPVKEKMRHPRSRKTMSYLVKKYNI